jgi:hypothetical protein
MASDDMVRRMRMLRRIRWSDAEHRFCCPSPSPKSVLFARPHRPLDEDAFAAGTARRGLRLAGPTRMLFRGATIFINGEAHIAGAPASRRLSRLADRRSLPPARLDRESAQLLYPWYRAGYLTIGDP